MVLQLGVCVLFLRCGAFDEHLKNREGQTHLRRPSSSTEELKKRFRFMSILPVNGRLLIGF